MLLAIDIGNTNTHIGVFTPGRKLIATEIIPTAQIQHLLKRLNGISAPLNRGAVSSVRHILISSINPPAEAVVRKWIRKVFDDNVNVLKAGRDFRIPLANRTKYPDKVGTDRLLNAFAAYQMFHRPLIVIGFGTAITFDVVSAKGEFLGGVIAPGLNTMAKSLHQNCALLPMIKLTRPARILGRDTETALVSGVYFGTIGLVKEILARLITQSHTKPLVIATGGDAGVLQPQIPQIKKVVPHLALKGLVAAYRHVTTS